MAFRGQLAGQSGSGLEVQLPLGICCWLSLSMHGWGQMKYEQGAAKCSTCSWSSGASASLCNLDSGSGPWTGWVSPAAQLV